MKKKWPSAKHVRLILCEDARQESSGKVTLVGAFPGEVIVVHGPTPLADAKVVAVIANLCLVFFVAGGAGEFDVGIGIDAPDGTSIFEQRIGRAALQEGGTGTIVGQIRPFGVPAFGRYVTTLALDEKKYAFEFEIREAAAVK